MKLYRLIFCASLSAFTMSFSSPSWAALSPLPDGMAGQYLSARIAALRGSPSDAARFTELIWHQDDQNKDILRRLILLKITTGDISASFKLAERLLELERHAPLAVLLMGLKAMAAGDQSAAKDYFEGFEKSRHKDIGRWLSVLMLNVWTTQAMGMPKKARAQLERLEQLHPRLGSLTSFQKALMDDLAGEAFLARGSYKKALQLYGHLFSRLGRVGEAYGCFLERSARRDDKEQAERIYRDLIPMGGVEKIVGEAGLARLARGDKPRALVTNVNEGAAEVLYYYSTLAFFSNRLDDAALYAHLALFLRKSFDAAHLRLAAVSERQNDFRAAIKSYRQIKPRSDFALLAGVQIAFAYEENEQKDLAESQLFALARQHRNDEMPLAALGGIYRARRDFVKSADIYSRAIERAREKKAIAKKVIAKKAIDWELYFSRGIALERSGQWERAEKDLRRALALSGDDPNVLNYLGYSWVDRGRHLERALKMIKRAVRKEPNRGDIADSLGWAYYRLGWFEEAVRYLERAVQLSPHEAVINDHLGDALWRVGRKVEARYQWQHVIDLKPSVDVDLENVKRKREEGLAQLSSPEKRL